MAKMSPNRDGTGEGGFMKVYILIYEEEYSGSNICGVFSSKAHALTYMRKNNMPMGDGTNGYAIVDYEVNKPDNQII